MYQQVKLDEVCVRKIETISSDENGLIDYFDIASVDNTKKKIISHQSLKVKEAPSRAKQIVQLNDILVSTVRPNLNAIAMIDNKTKNKMVASTGFCVLRASEKIEPRYLFYFVQSPTFINSMTAQATGASYPAVSNSIVKSSHIPLPDLPTQRRIADTLDKVSEGIEVCRKMLGELDLMVKAKFVEMFGNIPETEFATMGSVCSLITDGTHQPPKFVDSGIPFLFVSNITTNMLTYNAEKFISAETYAELMKRTPVEIGDILLSTVGSYGHPAIVKSNKQFSFQRHIAFLKPRHNIIDSTFLHSAILTAGVQRQIEAKVKGIAQKTLNLSEIRTLRFPLPPLQEQERYAALVKNINKSKLTIQEIRDKMETEKLALMQEYFK